VRPFLNHLRGGTHIHVPTELDFRLESSGTGLRPHVFTPAARKRRIRWGMSPAFSMSSGAKTVHSVRPWKTPGRSSSGETRRWGAWRRRCAEPVR